MSILGEVTMAPFIFFIQSMVHLLFECSLLILDIWQLVNLN